MPYQPLRIDQSDVRYAYGPDSVVQPGVPTGETIAFDWIDSAIYPGTVRKFWVHVPRQYDPSKPASLMVFQDGWWYLDPDGQVEASPLTWTPGDWDVVPEEVEPGEQQAGQAVLGGVQA